MTWQINPLNPISINPLKLAGAHFPQLGGLVLLGVYVFVLHYLLGGAGPQTCMI